MAWRALAAGVFGLGLLGAGGAAQAQVYKCAKDGRPVFSDRPCGDAQQQLKVAPAGPAGSLDVQVLTTHYPVHGNDLKGAYRYLAANGPNGFSGWARWNVEYDFDTVGEDLNCRVSAVRVKVQGQIMMPRWEQRASASEAEQRSWDASYNGLRIHEEGHIQHGREFALLLKERLMGLAPDACAMLPGKARQQYVILRNNLDNRDREYDRRTHHGLRQNNPDF